MTQVIDHPTKPEDQAALRRELLRLIVKSETARREGRGSQEK
jgi:hypothetical protein